MKKAIEMNFNFGSEGITPEQREGPSIFHELSKSTVKGLVESVLFVKLISCPTVNPCLCCSLIRQAFPQKYGKKNF